jgi:hypothetical protein
MTYNTSSVFVFWNDGHKLIARNKIADLFRVTKGAKSFFLNLA